MAFEIDTNQTAHPLRPLRPKRFKPGYKGAFFVIVKSSRTFVRSAGSWSVLSECMKYVYDPFHWSTRIFWMKNSGNTKEINMGRYHATMNHEAAGQGKGECIWLHNWTENMFKYIPLAGCVGYNNSGPCPMTCRVVLCRRFSISYPSGINANNLVKYLDNQKIHDCAKCPSLCIMRISQAGAASTCVTTQP